MTQYTATRALASKPTPSLGWQNCKFSTFETYEVATAPAANDTLVLCKLPKGALIIGGQLITERLASGTSAGSASLGVNIGVDVKVYTQGGTSVATTSTSNCLGTFGPLDYAAVTGIKPESGVNMPLGGLLYSDGPLRLSDNGNVYVTFSSSATSFVTGQLTLRVDYVINEIS